MKVTTIQDISQVKELPDLIRFSSQAINQMLSVLNGHVGLSDNCDTSLIGVSFIAANTQYSFPHNLNRIPIGYITAQLSANMVLYSGNTPSTSDVIYLQSSAAGSGKVLVF